VTLETNATLIDAPMARALKAAGLDKARVHVPIFGAALDEVTRDPGGFEAAMRGAQALRAAGVAIEASAPVVRSTLDTLPALPAQLAAAGFGALVLGVPVASPDASELLGPAQAAAAIARTEARAREAGLPLRIAPDASIPPCAFEQPIRVAHLFSLTPGGRDRPGYRRPDGCAACSVADRCPGFPVAMIERGQAAPRPLEGDRARRRLSVISTVEHQIERELQQDDVYRRPGEAAVPARIVRINFQCNQACRFCFVSTHLPKADDAAIERAIVEIAEQRGVLVLSGGEPTLNPRLVDWVRLGRARGAVGVDLQTNAMRLGDDGLAERLRDAGVDQVFISLHGSRAEISDAVTEAPGTFDKTVRGIDAALRAGLRTRLNFVFCQTNLADFPDYVSFVHARWPGATVVVSFVAGSTDVVPRTKDLIPRYADVLPPLSEGLRRARELGVPIDGFESMCGIPLCLVPSDLTSFFELAEVAPGFDRGEFVYVDACTDCRLRGKCYGLRRGYDELHGRSELRTVR
jgi:MoaA/NifB/PqqE/SkfB family radical SAM enzyme